MNTELREADPKQESQQHLPPEAKGGERMDGPDVQRHIRPEGQEDTSERHPEGSDF